MKQDITCVFEGVANIGGIYISNLRAAQNAQLLQNLGIKAIVTVIRNSYIQHSKQFIHDHLHIPADDHESFNLSQYFQQTYNFIDLARKKTNVLVHCYAGVSRSATIVIAYLLRKYNYSLDKVISMVKRRRNKIMPNRGFIQQLKRQAQRMGIFQKKQENQVEQVLNKISFSPEKKRATSNYIPKKQVESIRAKNLQTNILYNLTNLKENQKKDQQIAYNFSQILKQQSQYEKLIVPKEQNKNERNATTKSLNLCSANTITYKSPFISQMQTFESIKKQKNRIVNEKLKKIEKLKSKVLQSERKKKSAEKRSFSDIQRSNQTNKKISKSKDTQLQLRLHTGTLKSRELERTGTSRKQKVQQSDQKTSLQSSHINRILFTQNSTLF